MSPSLINRLHISTKFQGKVVGKIHKSLPLLYLLVWSPSTPSSCRYNYTYLKYISKISPIKVHDIIGYCLWGAVCAKIVNSAIFINIT